MQLLKLSGRHSPGTHIPYKYRRLAEAKLAQIHTGCLCCLLSWSWLTPLDIRSDQDWKSYNFCSSAEHPTLIAGILCLFSHAVKALMWLRSLYP